MLAQIRAGFLRESIHRHRSEGTLRLEPAPTQFVSARMRIVLSWLVTIAVAGSAFAQSAKADPLGVLNAVRSRSCGNNGAAAAAHAPLLDKAAQAIAEGKTLRAAIDASGYRAVNSTLLVLDGARDEKELASLIGQSCAQIAQSGLRHAGSYQRGRTIWLVLAEPFTVPKLDQAAVRTRVLELVNQARAQARRCGNDDFAPAPPLRYSSVLEQAAAIHARDMAEHGSMSHTGRDGSTPAQRVTRVGYRWVATGENIAAGQRDPERVVRSWLTSPGHCANLMSPDYTEVGVAFATNAASQAGIFWTQVFGAPDTPAPAKR
jgi:uncharacterized protein YkwD